MAVQFADLALDEWLTSEIDDAESVADMAGQYHSGYITALKKVQKQLHEFWGSALKIED